MVWILCVFPVSVSETTMVGTDWPACVISLCSGVHSSESGFLISSCRDCRNRQHAFFTVLFSCMEKQWSMLHWPLGSLDKPRRVGSDTSYAIPGLFFTHSLMRSGARANASCKRAAAFSR